MAYCTIDQARAQGCTGTDTEVQAWIATAQTAVDAFTQQWWEPRTGDVVADLPADGLVLLPRRVRTVTAIAPYPLPQIAPEIQLPPNAFVVRPAATAGDIDAVQVGFGGYDVLVAGAEPWNGGWQGLMRYYGAKQVRVTGTWGLDAPPPMVSLATAMVAAALQAKTRPTGDPMSGIPGGVDVDDEGNNVRIQPAVNDDGTYHVGFRPSTGSAQADAMLAPAYLNARPALGGL
ncbi:hypothetical protein [Saccharothrix sp. ST-888]|uniref:hypothetical protein n=1 Tax=Saccharothrix sp. ST-888 TaxID=1427391 RepID=UPI0005EC93FB|nr:hypothetical protein [Saccharothrix sp. ST-888]KJK55642.1 hypothetical protein UK12_27360 [Saccharothrix sp. ST-888]